ncbi:HAMP domain-containing histidine kinase [Rhizobium sp. TRM95111]|uniref:sensor histidine kinase n=1 Tax=Rhizobium alarense TaxID=2846851 RepID=UPI001F43AF57|nr:HAMP domain-containing sensor histidine kinase [Rhizobium alarense]MCF3641290.1 HAMP domain-containing histidine kinase [Rhizobium alarense]
MVRAGLSARLAAIAATAMLTTWVTIVSVYYLSKGLDEGISLPAPQQLVAMAGLLAEAGPADRQKVLAIVRSPLVAVSVETDMPVPETGSGNSILEQSRFEPYREALGAALLSVTAGRVEGGDRWLPRPFAGSVSPVVFRIRLNDAEVLQIEARAPYVVTWFGLPAGFGAGVIGTVFALVAVLLLHSQIRPLGRLAAAVDRMDPAGDPVALPDMRYGAEEMKTLVGAFDRLQGRLHSMMRARLALIGGIQHDVRTFATRLRLRIEHIPDEEQRGRAAGDIEAMITLLDDSLLAGRAGVGALDEELLDLAGLVIAEVRERPDADRVATLYVTEEARAAQVLGDRLALRRVVFNLVDNAIKYGAAAHVRLARDDQVLVLTVDDEGPGIPAGQREMLLEPFVRMEPSRARRTGGAGLGLAVARSLVEAHGGRLDLAEAPGGGGRALVRVPVFAGTG